MENQNLLLRPQDQKWSKAIFFSIIYLAAKSNLTWTHYVVKYNQNWHEAICGLDLF